MEKLLGAPVTPAIEHESCITCGDCTDICPTETLHLKDDAIEVEYSQFMGCIACGHCMMVCPENCISVSGRRLDPKNLVVL